LYRGIKQLLDNKSLQEKFIVNLQTENREINDTVNIIF